VIARVDEATNARLRDVKIGFQLYRTIVSAQVVHIVDMQKMAGPGFPFMDVCSMVKAAWTLA
jgi:hypothetical protein